MTEPYRITLSHDYGNPWGASSGIVIEYVRRRRALNFHGWFDHYVGIEGDTLTLADLFRQLHIPPAHVRAALRELEKDDG